MTRPRRALDPDATGVSSERADPGAPPDLNGAAGDESESTRARIAALKEELHESTRWAVRLDAELEALQTEVAKRTDWALQLQSQLAERTDWALRLQAETREQSQRIESLRAELAERTDWAQGLVAQIREHAQVIESLQAELAERTDWALRLDAQTVDQRRQIDLLEHELAASRTETDAARRQYAELAARHEAILGSRSWRLTRPLRALGRRLRSWPSAVATGVRRAVRILVSLATRIAVPQFARLPRLTRLLPWPLRRRVASAVAVHESGLLDRAWYLDRYPEVARSGLDPLLHYLRHGAAAQFDPGPGFHTRWYLARYPDVAKAGVNPLVHYAKVGRVEGREPVNAAFRTILETDLFDEAWYLANNPDVAHTGLPARLHYYFHGLPEGRNPSASFDASEYLVANPDVAASGAIPFVHYATFGRAEGRTTSFPLVRALRESRLFDRWWYLANYPEVGDSGLDPLSHYVLRGSAAGLLANFAGIRPIQIDVLRALEATTLTRDPAAEALAIRFTETATPRASIIVPVHGQLETTLRCLKSLAASRTEVEFEVIVIDDASPDETPRLLPSVAGLRYLRNDGNLGFLESCNRAAASARGPLLIFLNNDTVVLPDWLDVLVTTFDERHDAGVVGSMLLYPDGTLQEAGGHIWKDATGWQFGWRKDPNHPRFNYLRETDYCSGAALAVRRDVWEELGGFDRRFAPAYYEDTDLCFAARARGFSVLYQPFARVVHFEGVTSGTTVDSGVKRHQEVNRPKFLAKWRSVLASHGQPTDPDAVVADRYATRTLLWIDESPPTPDRDSGSLDVVNYFRMLADAGWRIVLAPVNLLHHGGYTSSLERQGVECLHWPFVEKIETWLEAHGHRFDVVVLSRSAVATRFLPVVRRLAPRASVVFNTVDLHFLRLERQAAVEDSPVLSARARQTMEQELDTIRRADATIVVSPFERDRLAELGAGENVRVIPLFRAELPGATRPFRDREGICFVGGFRHPPNVDAVEFFLAEIWPRVRQALPTARLFVAGSDAPARWKELHDDRVEFLGFVPELADLLEQVRVSVAPLRYGAGMKGKVVSSLGHGVPVVATPIATEGMNVAAGREILVADGPEAFAEAVVRIHEDESLWNELSAAATAAARREFSVDALAPTVHALFDELGTRAKSRPNAAPPADPAPADEAAPQPATTAPASGDRDRLEQEIARYRDCVNVHDLPEMFHWWSHRYLMPKIKACGFPGLDEIFLESLVAASRRDPKGERWVFSLGAGNCDYEVKLAGLARDLGCENLYFHCLDLNPHMLDRGRQLAADSKLADRFTFEACDLDRWEPARHYDVGIANHSLHHMVELERIFASVRKALGDDGVFLVNDMIGRNGHMRWPEALEVVERIWRELPAAKRYNHQSRALETEYVNWDCSREGNEGIRAQDILPLLMENFHFEVFLAFANVIDTFIDRSFGHNFDPGNAEDRELIDRIARLDDDLIDAGTVKPTHLLAVLRTRPVAELRCYRHWTPEHCVRRPDGGGGNRLDQRDR